MQIKLSAVAALLALSAGFVSAQTCTPDDLIDDYHYRVLEGNYKTNGGGIAGAVGATVNIPPSGGMEIVAGFDNSLFTTGAELDTHPGTAPTYNYWFTQFNPQICSDLTTYTSMELEIIADPGIDFNITLTQKSADCLTRAGHVDSQYHLLSSLLTPNGQLQTLRLPLSLFATNLVGQPYDFQHAKDLTLVNLHPQGAKLVLKNFVIRGDCNSSATPGLPPATASASAASSSAASASASASPKASSGVVASAPAFGFAIAALTAAAAMLF
ncbi:uncharacterized protein BJ171DRAFT_577857 [Polychytrium aggregatum]|uniref:uncharacterized protein n=1 Tax=Polychytrium aggregatum TaxID=110093 RepID=UPI0022FEE0AF|nr:uncharacterized protein BJ171DRAFT_577857 [Polychytrium aggregatum]KAI9208773.1 hypothetical protein BJ171DRAFT_577857 [Polychytrium aggregatum]